MIRVWFTGRGGVASLEDRARALARHFPADVAASFDFRGGPGPAGALRAFTATLAAARRHDVLWILSQHPARVAAAVLGRLLFRTRFVVDTGDLLYESLRTAGAARAVLELGRLWEVASVRLPDAVVVRGTAHLAVLAGQGSRRGVLIPDGVDCDAFARRDASAARADLGVTGKVTVGVVATVGYEPRLGLPSPGWDVVECLARLPDLDLAGVIVGDGPGVRALDALAERRGVATRLRRVGRVPLPELPAYLSAIDVFLHTALNNPMSAVRTTGKLPLLLASGCAAVVSEVGEASRVLEGTGMLLEFDGTPETYAVRLAARVRALIEGGELERWRAAGPAIARREFDYARLAERAVALVRELARPRPG